MNTFEMRLLLGILLLFGSLCGGQTIPSTNDILKGDGAGGAADTLIYPSPDERSVETYASFATAISAIGSTPKVLVISTPQSVSTNVVVPSNVILKFEGLGRLAITAGHTVTIWGPIQAPIRQIFSINDSQPIVFIRGSVQEIWCQWFGAVADATGATGVGTDDTLAIQAAINSTPGFGAIPVKLGSGRYRITGNILMSSFNYQVAMKLVGLGGKYADTSTVLVWDGNSSTPMVSLHNLNSIIDGIEFLPAQSCLCGIDIDHEDGSPNPCTADIVRNCSFDSSGGPVMTYGIRLGLTATANCEHMQFLNCSFFNGGTAGIYVPSTTGQAKDCKVNRCSFFGTAYGVTGGNYTFEYDGCNFQYLSVCAINVTGSGDFMHIQNSDSEGCPQFLKMGLGYSNILIESSRFGPSVSSEPSIGGEYIYGGNNITLIGCQFDFPAQYFYFNTSTQGRLTLQNVNLPSINWDAHLKANSHGNLSFVSTYGVTVNDSINSVYNLKVPDGYYAYGSDPEGHDFTGPQLLVEGGYNGFQTSLAGKIRFSGVISPPELTADVNDYAPAGILNASVMRINGGALNRNITGISIDPHGFGFTGPSADGTLLEIENVGATNSLSLKNQDSGSSSANQFLLKGHQLLIPVNGSALLRYDAITGAWRVVNDH